MTTILRAFYDALTVEERKFVPHLASDNLGVLLRCAINELDWFYYNIAKSDNPTGDQQEHYYILQLGVTRLIQLALDERESFDVPVVLFQRKKELTLFVLKIASALGMIEHGRRVAQTVALGTGRIEQDAEKEFTIILPNRLVDEDYLDRTVIEHYKAVSRSRLSSLRQSEKWAALDAEVNVKLRDLVYPFETHFIGYDSDPLLDDYFFGFAFHEIQLQEGYDSFHYTTEFGGVRFQCYILATAFLLSLSFKHERFVEALVEKDSSIRLENILTITSDTPKLIESIRDAVNHFGPVYDGFEEINLEAARKIFDVLSVSRRSTALLSAPGSPLPLLIQCSDEGVIRCITGANSEPIRFLLESLRYHFTKEYDKNQRAQEQSMQRAVKRVLDDSFEGLEYRENIVLSVSGKTLTDIDLVALDQKQGTVILFQLKQQELYGHNLHSRRIRSERLQNQVSDWLEALDLWDISAGMSGVRKSLRLSHSFPRPTFMRLIISKHYSHPLRSTCQRSDTAFASWPQFYNAIALFKEKDQHATVDKIIPFLQDFQSPDDPPEHLPEPTTKWTIDEVTFTTKQNDSEFTKNNASPGA